MLPPELQPTLSSELVSVRPLRADDYDALFLVASDPLIWAQHPKSDRCLPAEFRTYFRNMLKSGGALAVIENASGRIIGSSRFYGTHIERGEIGIGHTFLAREFWGGRYNGELKRLMIAHAFQYARVVAFHVSEKNLRSQAALRKIGATFSRTRSRVRMDGSVTIDWVYEIRREKHEPR